MHPLSIFIESLRTDGFHLTVYDYHRINFALQADSPWNLTKLRDALMALLVKTPEQEMIFQQRFDAFFKAPESSLIAPFSPMPASPDTPPQFGVDKVPVSSETDKSSQPPPDFSGKGKFKRGLKWIFWLIVILVLVSGVGYYFYRPQLVIAPTELGFGEQFLGTQTNKTVEISNLGLAPLLMAPMTLSETDAFEIITDNCSETALARSRCTIEIQFTPRQVSDYTATLTIDALKKPSFSQQLSFSGSGIKKPIQTEEQNDSQRLYPDVPVIKNITPLSNPDQSHWKIYAGIAAVLLLVLLAYGFWLWRSRQLPQEIPPLWQIDKPRRFSPNTVGGKPQPRLAPAILDRLADSIGYFQSTQASKKLDVHKTVQLSIQRRISTLVFYPRQQLRTVLILEDALAKPLVWNPIAGELAIGLQQRGVPVLYGQFYGSYQQICTSEGVYYELKTLAYDLDSYVLLIFSDGKSLRYHQDAPMLKFLAEWYQAAWLELREIQAWDESTAMPAHFGLPIYPATAEGLLQAIGRFLSEASQQDEFTNKAKQARGLSMRMGNNLTAGVEEFLGDALPWAQCCAWMQPVSLGLAEALREQFFNHLPVERVERLFTLPNTAHTKNGLSFSRPILATLRAGFLRRFDEKEQQEKLQFILEKLLEVEPEDKDSPAHLAWEWYWQRVNLELNPDEALQRLAELAETHLGEAIRTDLEHTVPPSKNVSDSVTNRVQHGWEDFSIPLRVRPKTQVALQRLQRLAKHSGIPKLSALPVGIGHWIIVGLFVTAFFWALGFSVRSYKPALTTYKIELVNSESVLAWGVPQKLGDENPLPLATGTSQLTFLSQSGFIKTQEIGPLTNNLTLELGTTEESLYCVEPLPAIGLTIQSCALDDSTDSQLTIPTWHDSLTTTTSSAQLISIGLSIQTQNVDETALQTLRDTLLKTHSVDKIYRIAKAADDKLYLSEALTKIQKQLTPWQQKSQLIWWATGNDVQTTELTDFIASFGVALNLGKGTDLSWVASVQKLLTSNDAPLSTTEIAAALGQPAPGIVLIGSSTTTVAAVTGETKTFRDKLKDGSLGPEMIWIPAGSFRMGDIQGGGDSDEQPVHKVSIQRFAIGRYEVIFDEYDKFAEATGREKPNDQGWGRGNRPVINVFWEDATAYAAWLSKQTNKAYRLPTEAQWEYAARSGTETSYWWGNKIGSNKANCYGDMCGDSFKYTAPVGSFEPNQFGLHDTVGNVWEWTCSEYENSYTGKESKCISKTGSLRGLRGGAWSSGPRDVRTADRSRDSHGGRSFGVGFRLARLNP